MILQNKAVYKTHKTNPSITLPPITKETLLEIQQEFPPLKQVKAGILSEDIVATKGQVLITNDHRDYPARARQTLGPPFFQK